MAADSLDCMAAPLKKRDLVCETNDFTASQGGKNGLLLSVNYIRR